MHLQSPDNDQAQTRLRRQANGDHHDPTSRRTYMTTTTAINQTAAQQPFTSSSLSSTADLSGIIASSDPNFNQTLPLNSTNVTTTTSNPRQQHTLSSIKTRSRSPIVVMSSPAELTIGSTTKPLTQVGDGGPEASNLHHHQKSFEPVQTSRLPTNPLEGAAKQSRPQTQLLHIQQKPFDLSPIERISMRNFERRRIIHGTDVANSSSSNNSNKGQKTSGQASDLEDHAGLSLEQVIGGQSPTQTVAAKAATSSTDQNSLGESFENYPSELHELKQKLSSSGAGGGTNNDLTTICSTTGDLLLSSEEEDFVSNQQPNEFDSSKAERLAGSAELKLNETARGYEIVWLNFSYSVHPNIFENPRWGKINKLFHKEHRTILKDLSGGLKSGQMVALMGPSGAGKTCLLECISGFRLTGIGGKILIRGRKSAQLVIVPQFDDFLPQFTVEEIICYGSKMKNSANTDHKAVTDNVIEQLGLQVCRKNNIQKCSGGQRKRVAIAQELVSKPNILILDEPTSGLDSSCCHQTMRVLRDILDKSVYTKQPMAIVTTIHQPSAKVFKMFDSIYLLGKTGHTAYSGPPDELLPTIREITGLECPQYSNPSDYMIELVSYDYGEAPVEKLIEYEKEKAKQFVKDYQLRVGTMQETQISTTTLSSSITTLEESLNVKKVKQSSESRDPSDATELEINQQLALKGSKSDTNLIIKSLINNNDSNSQLKLRQFKNSPTVHADYANNISVPLRKATRNGVAKHPFFWHIYVHMHRSFLQSIRDPMLNNMRILIHIGFAILLVLLYGEKSGEARGCPPILGLPIEITDPDNESMIDIADNVGYLFMCIMMITYVSLMSTVLTFPIDIKTVGKEYKNGWYGTVTYFLGKSIADLPFIIIYPVAYCLITWYMTNQAQDHIWRFISFTGLIIMNSMNSQSFGLILGAIFVNSITAATFLGPVITIPWYLFTGFTKRLHRLGEPYYTTSNFLFTRYIFEGLLVTVYGHERCNCSEFLHTYHELRYEEAVRLGHMISVETLSSLDYYDGLDTIANIRGNKSMIGNWLEKTVDAASTVFADGEELNLASLMETNGKANSLFSFGLDFEPTCPSNYQNFVVQDFRLDDYAARRGFIASAIALVVIRVLTFIIVIWKIRARQL